MRLLQHLIELHWLTVKARIEYKIILLTYKALKHNEDKYSRKMLNRYGPGANPTPKMYMVREQTNNKTSR